MSVYERQYTDRVNWENTPSVSTPLSAEKLNVMDNGLEKIDAAAKSAVDQLVEMIEGGGGGSYTAGAGISIANNVITNTRKGSLSGVIDEITSGGYAHTQINNALDSITAGGLVVLKAETSGTANTVRIQYGEQASQSQAYRLCDTDLEYTTINVSVGDTIILMFDTTGYKLIVLSILNNSGGSGGDSYAGLGIGKMTSFTNDVIDTDIDLHRAPIDGDRLLVYISETVNNPSSIKTYNNGVAVTTDITFSQTYPVGLAMFRYTLLGWNCIQTIAYSAGTGISITGTTIKNSAPQLGMNIGYGEVTSVTDGNIGTFNGNADYLDIDFKVNASPYNGSYTLYLAMGGSTVIMKYATLKDSYGSAYDKDIQQGTILHCLSKVSGTGTEQDPIVVKVIDENVIANPTGTPDYNLKKVKVGNYIYDTLGIKPYDAYSISNGGITIHTADPYTFNGQIIAVNTGAHSGTTTNAWYLVLVGNGSSYPIEMTNADGTDFKDALSENELLFVYVDTHNPQKAILLKTAGASGGSASALTDLTDTNITSPTNGQVLTYNGATGKWGNQNPSGGVAESVVGTVESGTTASQAYAVGEHFIRNDAFCTAIAAIASGATLTLNTNYVEGSISQAIARQGTYSTTETEIGTFLGKRLYRKVINFGGLPNNTRKYVSANIGTAIVLNKIYGIAIDTYTLIPMPSSTNVSGWNIDIGYNKINAPNNPDTVFASTAQNYSAVKESYIVIEYTKS